MQSQRQHNYRAVQYIAIHPPSRGISLPFPHWLFNQNVRRKMTLQMEARPLFLRHLHAPCPRAAGSCSFELDIPRGSRCITWLRRQGVCGKREPREKSEWERWPPWVRPSPKRSAVGNVAIKPSTVRSAWSRRPSKNKINKTIKPALQGSCAPAGSNGQGHGRAWSPSEAPARSLSRGRTRANMSKIRTFRMGLGVILGAAAGISLFYYYYYYRQKRKKIWRKDKCTFPNSQRDQNALNPQEHREILRPYNQVPRIRPVPMEGGDNDPYVALLTREEQAEVLNRLDFVLRSLKELRNEVEELRNSLQGLAGEIIGEVRTHIEESQKFVRRRRFVYPRERSDSTGSSSIYFTASLDATNTDDGESEGGYLTANGESDYDRESEKQSEEGEDEISCETVKTGRKDSMDLVNEDETAMTVDSAAEEELGRLLQQADVLHRGNDQEKREGFQTLLNNSGVYGDKQDFLWRLARAYSDMHEITEDTEEKKSYVSDGKEEAEKALLLGDESSECHQWYAVLCGQFSEHESIQKRIQAGHDFKKHIDKAISLKSDDPKSYYLLGQWCYKVSHLGWLERKTAAALYEEPPTASVQDALQNFLKAEELSPGFSKMGRVYIAKCYRELGDNSEAARWLSLASELPVITKEDAESNKEIEEMQTVSED